MAQRTNVQYVEYFPQSSTARRVIPSLHPLSKAKTRRAVRICVDPVAFLGTVVAVCMLTSMIVGVNHLQAVRQDTLQMASYVEQLEFENRQLKAEYAASCDLEAIRQTALALGMIPQENAVHTEITVELPQPEEPVTIWNRIGTFLTGLFA